MRDAVTPLPKVTPTAINADNAISRVSPAARVMRKLPLRSESNPTESVRFIVAEGIATPFNLTANVTVVPTATDSVPK